MYVALVKGDDLPQALTRAADAVSKTLAGIPASRADHRYAEGKWSIKELVQHLIDTERILSYRALCFARQEPKELPGFEEDSYTANSGAAARDLTELAEEYRIVHAATLALFKSFSSEDLLRYGRANGSSMSVRALGWALAGHSTHHLNILKERYL